MDCQIGFWLHREDSVKDFILSGMMLLRKRLLLKPTRLKFLIPSKLFLEKCSRMLPRLIGVSWLMSFLGVFPNSCGHGSLIRVTPNQVRMLSSIMKLNSVSVPSVILSPSFFALSRASPIVFYSDLKTKTSKAGWFKAVLRYSSSSSSRTTIIWM